ncbi:class I SAM-dependent methyltransferase [Poseidonocella pacifica]|uniref:class I SAM-dependent methyltransferase n=1 Tax=Poseidonocella pacifica TaxID=871651 RepID=UPI001FE04019|nr:SAM-dependent methyltransferase [Poseidonocella pacifica]
MAEDRLGRIYATSDDPWGFRTSAYEQEKFRATAAALPRRRHRSALEIGCGNGELARHLAPRCGRYTGVDAVAKALCAARRAVPAAHFHQLFLPARLPAGMYDLIVVSEMLYFLTRAGIARLANQITGRWPKADVVTVTWLGPSGNMLSGSEALGCFALALGRPARCVRRRPGYRIDVFRGRS